MLRTAARWSIAQQSTAWLRTAKTAKLTAPTPMTEPSIAKSRVMSGTSENARAYQQFMVSQHGSRSAFQSGEGNAELQLDRRRQPRQASRPKSTWARTSRAADGTAKTLRIKDEWSFDKNVEPSGDRVEGLRLDEAR